MSQENKIYHGDNIEIMKSFNDNSIDFIYSDPPFNTGKTQKSHDMSYEDKFDNLVDFLRPRLEEAKRILKSNGSIMIHLDYREVHYVKVCMDEIFGRENFINEIIWSYDYGGRSKKKWSCKHDNILWYVMNKKDYTYNYDEHKRVPYMAPGLVGPEKAKIGKTQTDVIFQTIVPTQGDERTGYPTQKPLGLIDQFIKIHTNPGDLVLDFFAGSGTLGESAKNNGRNFIMIDSNQESIDVMKERLDISDISSVEKSLDS